MGPIAPRKNATHGTLRATRLPVVSGDKIQVKSGATVSDVVTSPASTVGVTLESMLATMPMKLVK